MQFGKEGGESTKINTKNMTHVNNAESILLQVIQYCVSYLFSLQTKIANKSLENKNKERYKFECSSEFQDLADEI